MFKLAISTALCAVCLYAADFWTKPYTDWSDKEVQKMGENSPWAKSYEVVLGEGGGSQGRGGGRGRGGGGGGGEPGGDPGATPGGEATATLYIRWQSALPVKQATVRSKYGAEAGTSPDAKKILDADEPAYVIVIDGLNRRMVAGGDAETLKKTMLEQTALVIKGKEPIKPIDFRTVGQGRLSAVFAFPKTTPITVDDKEVEFQSKIGTLTIKQKFRLKDMVYNGKLEL